MKFTKTSFGLANWAGLLTLLLMVASASVRAEEALSPPQLVIQQTSNTLQKSLQKPEYKSDFAKATQFVEQTIEPYVDFDRVSILALGKYWRTATPEQKTRFKKEFRTLLVRTYTTAFTEYANWNIRYLPLQLQPSDTKTLVRTEILQAGAQPVAINYRMINENGKWKVFDVLIEGISLIQNYRISFTSEISKTGSMDGLLAQLAQRNASAHKEPVANKPKSAS